MCPKGMFWQGFSLLKSCPHGLCPLNGILSPFRPPLRHGDEFLAQGLPLKSHQRCSSGIRTLLSADQSSSSTLTESSFLFDPCLIHRGTVM